jgi:hypothetical protein
VDVDKKVLRTGKVIESSATTDTGKVLESSTTIETARVLESSTTTEATFERTTEVETVVSAQVDESSVSTLDVASISLSS